jgi:hypothetical protein
MSDDIEILTHEQVLAILSRKAEAGSVTAAVALERALRVRAREDDQPLDDEELALQKELESLIATKPDRRKR